MKKAPPNEPSEVVIKEEMISGFWFFVTDEANRIRMDTPWDQYVPCWASIKYWQPREKIMLMDSSLEPNYFAPWNSWSMFSNLIIDGVGT